MAGDAPDSENLTQSDIRRQIQRHLNGLTDSSKITRKRALIELRKETISRKLGGTVLQELTSDILKPVLKCFSDSSEINREMAVTFTVDFFSLLPCPENALPYIMPTLVQRLGQEEITEPAEELRQVMVENLLASTVELCGKRIAGFLDEVVQVLKYTIADPFGNVKKASCDVTRAVARCIPEYFHMQSTSLIVPLMKSITHQHSKVRIAVIEATGDVIQFGDGKNVDDVVSHLAQRFFDQSSQVRKCVTRIIGRWLLELPDRYSFFYKFIPLILTSLSDEIPEIQEEAAELWEKAGLQYEKENENDMKDKLDFVAPLPTLYPPGVARPCLGCRELVQRNLSKLTSAIIRDLGDWVPETRMKTSQLLYQLLLHAEEYITQHMQPLMQALTRACMDEENVVRENAKRSAQLVGAFVEPQVFCQLVLQVVSDQAGVNPSGLEILAAVISGCSDEVLGGKLHEIVEAISNPDVCRASEKPEYHAGLLHCVDALVVVCHDRMTEISLPLFTVVITALALSKSAEISANCEKSLEGIARALEMQDVEDLFSLHSKEVIDSMHGSYESWTKYSVEQMVFETLIARAGSVVGQLLEEIMPILKVNFDPEKDAELRLKFFTLLAKLLVNAENTYNLEERLKREHVQCIVTDMISPNLVWKAGRTAGAVRTIAMSSLWALLKSGALDAELASSFLPDPLLPILSSCFEDDNKTTRSMTASVLTKLFSIAGIRLNPDTVLHKVYIDLLKRLDDASDEIRLIITESWVKFFDCFPKGYDISLYRAHMEEMYSGLLVHMDDPGTEMQLAVLDVLKSGGRICPGMLIKEVEKVRHKHRTTHYCDVLIEYLQQLPSM